MAKLLLTAIGILFTSSAMAADYFACMHDAAEAREECFRWAGKNHVSDSTCNPEYKAAVEVCERMRLDDRH
jgi:hypothetical protein